MLFYGTVVVEPELKQCTHVQVIDLSTESNVSMLKTSGTVSSVSPATSGSEILFCEKPGHLKLW